MLIRNCFVDTYVTAQKGTSCPCLPPLGEKSMGVVKLTMCGWHAWLEEASYYSIMYSASCFLYSAIVITCIRLYLSREHRNELDEYCTKCDVILEQIQHLLGALEELQGKYTFVLTQTRALHDACEQSIQEQVFS